MDKLFESLLDKNIDDLNDLPEFKSPETGVYKLSVLMTTKEINKKPAVTADFTIRECVELADPTIPVEEHSKAGDKFSVAFLLKDEDGKDNDMAWSRLKEFVKPFQAHYGQDHLARMIEHLETNSTDITATVKKVERKKEKGVFDARVSDVTID